MFCLTLCGQINSIWSMNLQSRAMKYERLVRTVDDTAVYLLITTSSKIYCMPLNSSFAYTSLGSSGDDYFSRSGIIYEEHDLSNNWITDAFYIRAEDLIYVNVYNSSAASSIIFTLKYVEGVWVKQILYRDQSYCLGKSFKIKKSNLFLSNLI